MKALAYNFKKLSIKWKLAGGYLFCIGTTIAHYKLKVASNGRFPREASFYIQIGM